MRIRLLFGALAVAATASVGIGAQQSGQTGTVSSDVAAQDIQTLAVVSPSEVYGNSNYQTGGTGMRNQRRGSIMINGVTPGGVTPVIKANLYWALIRNTTGPLTTNERKITLSRQWPTTSSKPANMSFLGNEVGTTASPCWPGQQTKVLKADVTAVVVGNGLYRMQVYAGGSYRGEDPWNGVALLPLQEGASLVVIYPNSGTTTAVYDVGLTTMFSGTLNYQLALPFSASTVKIDFAGADGQYGTSRLPGAAGGETTTINGVHVGSTSPWNDSWWNGKSGLALPQLWDNDGRRLALPATTSTLDITHNSPGDCLVPVANFVTNAGI